MDGGIYLAVVVTIFGGGTAFLVINMGLAAPLAIAGETFEPGINDLGSSG